MGADTVLETDVFNGESGHAAKHNAVNTQVNYLTETVAELGEGGGAVDLDEDLGPFAAGKGIILTSPDGETVVRLRVDDDGELVTEPVEGGEEPPPETTPDEISGLLAWFKASDLSALTNGDPVVLWSDAANSNDATSGPGIANSLLYATSGINGHPAVRFDQASDHKMFVASTDLSSVKPFTFFTVVKATDFGHTGYLLLGGATRIALMLNATTGRPNLDKAEAAGIGTATDGPDTGVGAVVCCRYDGSGNWAFFIDGVAAGSGTADQTFGSAVTITFGGGLDGYIGEWIMYSAALSPTDRQAVEDYLAAAWDTP